jgi:hypothetical protein
MPGFVKDEETWSRAKAKAKESYGNKEDSGFWSLANHIYHSMMGKKASGGKYGHINFKPPAGVAKAAERGLELRKKATPSNRGGLSTSQAKKEGVGSGVQRAVNLKNRDEMSPQTVRRMLSFFQRHEKNKSIDKGKAPHEDKGYVAWMLWGGDPGYSWAKKIVKQMESADKRSKKASDSLLNPLDRIAGRLEGKGLTRLASMLDIVANTVEKKMELKMRTNSVGPVHEILGIFCNFEGSGAFIVDMESSCNWEHPAAFSKPSGKIPLAMSEEEDKKGKILTITAPGKKGSSGSEEFVMDTLKELFETVATVGNTGHSFNITFVPVDAEESHRTIFWDGDGSDFLDQKSVKLSK